MKYLLETFGMIVIGEWILWPLASVALIEMLEWTGFFLWLLLGVMIIIQTMYFLKMVRKYWIRK